ncbi:MAG: hypothetical protein R3B09_17370 [Nannocystaceae bacterium]
MSILLAWALSGAPGAAGVRLEWSAPPTCPSAVEVQAELDRLLDGRAVIDEVVARAEVVAAADGGGLVATLQIGEAAPRILHAGECVALGRAIALVIAVAVDPVAVAGRLALADAPPPAEAPPEDPPPAVDEAPPEDAREVPEPPAVEIGGGLATAEAPRRRPPIAHSLGLGGGALYGVTPAWTGAIAGSYRLDRGALRVEARALYATPRRVDYEDGVGALLQAVTIGALACAAPELRRLRAPLCVGLEGGPLIGVGRGSATTERRVALWASALVSTSLVARIRPRLALTLRAELAIALRRPAFHIGDREVLSRAPQVGGRGILGLEVRLGRIDRRGDGSRASAGQ